MPNLNETPPPDARRARLMPTRVKGVAAGPSAPPFQPPPAARGPAVVGASRCGVDRQSRRPGGNAIRAFLRARYALVAAAMLLTAAGPALAFAPASARPDDAGSRPSGTPSRAAGASGRVRQGPAVESDLLPLRFEANQGQTHDQVRFLSRGKGYALLLTERAATFHFTSAQGAGRAVSLSWVGASATPALIHDDLASYHILYAPDTRRITGVIDYGMARLGDAASD